jgi:hypothetical protein
MKKLYLTLILSFVPAILKSDDIELIKTQTSFAYGRIGAYDAGLLLPDCGIGYRFQHNHIGTDISCTLIPLFVANIFKITPSFLVHFKPNLQSEWYTGLGCGFWACMPMSKDLHLNAHFGFCPELILGKQYLNSNGKVRFIEGRLGIPFLRSFLGDPLDIVRQPAISIYYGIAF